MVSYAKRHSNPLHLCSLNHKESWQPLMKKTFLNGNFPQELSDIEATILGICQGLPLMIVLVAGILSRLEPETRQWGEVAKNLSSLVTVGKDSPVVIELSCKHLPDYLKLCFLYFGAFKEDEEVSISKLIMLWIAEGFVQKSEQRVLEDVAEDYLNALISCSLIMVTRWKRCSRKAKACGVRELCLRKAREQNFLQLIREGDLSPFIFDNYRVTIGLEFNDHNQLMLSWLRGSFSIRSFLWFSSSPSWYTKRSERLWIFDKFKILIILDLSSVNIHSQVSFSRLESLLHLRYLALCATHFPKFPCNLLNLETLWVKRGDMFCGITLPQTIWRMVHLRHMDVPMLDLRNYRLEFFEGFSDLENLQSMATVELKYYDDDKNIMRRFPSLRKLKCKVTAFWDDAKKCYQFPKLDFLNQLESLHMFGHELPGSDRCKFYLPPNLRRLRLVRIFLPGTKLSAIPTLANLEKLVLNQAFTNKKWNVEDYVFRNLKFLELFFLNIEKWVASADSFPLLEELVLGDCYYLKEIPSCFEEIYTLKKIEIFRCMDLVEKWVMKIKEEIEERGGKLNILVMHLIL